MNTALEWQTLAILLPVFLASIPKCQLMHLFPQSSTKPQSYVQPTLSSSINEHNFVSHLSCAKPHVPHSHPSALYKPSAVWNSPCLQCILLPLWKHSKIIWQNMDILGSCSSAPDTSSIKTIKKITLVKFLTGAWNLKHHVLYLHPKAPYGLSAVKFALVTLFNATFFLNKSSLKK